MLMPPDRVSKLISCGRVGRSVALTVGISWGSAVGMGSGFDGCFPPCYSGNQTPWLHCSFPTRTFCSEQTSCDLVVTADWGKMVAACAGVGQGHRNAGSTSISSNCMVWKTFFSAANIVERIGVLFKRCVVCTASIDVNLKVAC